MQGWIPVPSSAKGRLVREALKQFGAAGYEAVNVADLASAAGVTTGALYHHFGSKLGLYRLIRDDVERRLLDRMEGAAAGVIEAGSDGALHAALLVGFDYVASADFSRLLAEPHPERPSDPVQEFCAAVIEDPTPASAKILVAAWRAALQAVAEGIPPQQVRPALGALRLVPRPNS